ncbi:uncharacterized protein LOC121800243 [Salvia splendens]|uniref:uncharacterized protein LOC121800243 n=1 Tax=Salvia splendens TaxID=180675 RepID=UPI001C258A4A|nr:uncharacterized protein LOC121800243 [Salvia splendens]
MSDTVENKIDPEQPSRLKNSKNVIVAFKLDGKNYPLWSRLMKVKIGGRGAYSHIRKEPPEPGSKGYDDWEEDDLVVFSWIVDNIEDEIIADFAHHQTSKALWDSLAVTFENKADKYLIYDLEEKIITIKQGNMDLETYYRRIHGLWINVDRCQKKPITCCDKGVDQYRIHLNEKRLFKFLAGLNPEYDSIKRDILKEEPYPSVESAYGWVKTEAARRQIMAPTSSSPNPETVSVNTGDTSSGDSIGSGLAAQSQRPAYRSGGPPRPTATGRPGNRPDKSGLWCTHCQKPKHTYETCFKRLGYPEWWEERQKIRAVKIAVGIAEDDQPRNQNGGRGGTTQNGPTVSTEVSTGGGGSIRGGRKFCWKRGDGAGQMRIFRRRGYLGMSLSTVDSTTWTR